MTEPKDPLRLLRDTSAHEAQMTALREKTNGPLLKLLAEVKDSTIEDLIEVQETFISYQNGRYFNAPEAIPLPALPSMLDLGMKERRQKLVNAGFTPKDYYRTFLLKNNLDSFIQVAGSDPLEDCAKVLDLLYQKNPSGITLPDTDIKEVWEKYRAQKANKSS